MVGFPDHFTALAARYAAYRPHYPPALVTEHRVTQTYGTLVAQTVGDDRSWAVDALGASAVRQLRFGGRPESFPGTQGLA